jgi:prepilin-type N-terminal cleavage/methylation domain-containing protein
MRASLNNSGFTLVETVVAVTVVGIVLGIVSIFSISSLQQSSVETARANLLGESQIAMDRIISDVRLSAGADLNNRWPDDNNSGGDFAWQSSSNTLVLATAVVDNNNEIVFADPAQYISEKNNVIYFVHTGTLYKRVLAAPTISNSSETTCPTGTDNCPADRAMLHNVTGFTVKYLNGDGQEVTPADARSVEVNIRTATQKFSQNIDSDYTTRAVFRND